MQTMSKIQGRINTFNLYYIDYNSQRHYVKSHWRKDELVEYLLDYANSVIETTTQWFEIVYNPCRDTYLLLEIGYKETRMYAEWDFIDDILEDLIEIMLQTFDLEFKLE